MAQDEATEKVWIREHSQQEEEDQEIGFDQIQEDEANGTPDERVETKVESEEARAEKQKLMQNMAQLWLQQEVPIYCNILIQSILSQFFFERLKTWRERLELKRG